jgi:hypothetical protein
MCSNGMMPDPETDCIFYDTYSMRITVLVPGWLGITARMDFRKYIEQQFRLEAPAHAGIKICWVNPKQMYLFEKASAGYLSALKAYKSVSKPGKLLKENYIKALGDLNSVMSALKNMYPPSQLDSCETMEFDTSGNLKENPVILNNTALAGKDEYVFEECSPVTEESPVKSRAAEKKIRTPKKKVTVKARSKGKKK